MTFLPSTSFLKGICSEDSTLLKISCVGPFYAEQITQICGRNTIGQFLMFCSNRDISELVRVLHMCSKNMRAGEPNDRGKAIPNINVRVLASLIQVLSLGRKMPDMFPHYKVQIDVSSSDLNNMLQNLM